VISITENFGFDLTKDAAETAKKQLEEVGAVIVIK